MNLYSSCAKLANQATGIQNKVLSTAQYTTRVWLFLRKEFCSKVNLLKEHDSQTLMADLKP